MTAIRNCPACGNRLPADAPAGLCPRCLLAGAFATAASPPNADFEPPAVAELAPLFPQLEIIELLGAGGMGAVYKARQPVLDRLVALKVLPPNDDASFAERFIREARALAKLNHPGIVHIYDFGQAGGHAYIVMEFVEGVNLRQAERAGTMKPAEALAVVPQICAALQFAHEAGVVHRDIKPENVLLDAKGRVKIADFGLAKLLGAGEPRHLTGTHQAMGTMHYMAPEQWEKPAAVDHRADIYSLGVVFYELLTGELPLGRFAPPSEKVQIDVRLDQVVLRALEKEPERRYQHASDVKTDVELIAAKPAPTVQLVTESPRQGWRTNDVIALMVILASVFMWPFGLVALPIVLFVSLMQKRSMLRVVDDALHFLRLHRTSTWIMIVCLAGVANAFWPWAYVGNEILFFGFDTRFSYYPVAITSGFLVLGFFFFITAQVPAFRLWRAGAALAGGATLIVLAAMFLPKTNGLRSWTPNIAETSPDSRITHNVLVVWPAPFVAMGLAIGLMGLGAVDLRGYLVNRSSLAGSSKDVNGITSPERPKEPPPLPDRLAAKARPSFMFYVGWPVLAIVAISSAAFATILTKPQGATPMKGLPEMVLGLGVFGPIVGIVLFVRWAWLALRPRRAKAFWVLTGVLAVIAVLGYGAAILPSLMPIGSRPTMRRSDSPREQIIGTWGMAPSGARMEFKTGGTFVYWFREADPNSPGTIPPGAIEKRIYGRFAWMDDETMELRSFGGSPMRLQFVDGTTTRSIEGAVIYLKIIPDGPEFVVLNNGEAIARLRRIP